MTPASDTVLEAEIRQACRKLHLPTIAARALPVAGEALREGRTHLAYLAALLQLEDRAERRRHRIAEAHFPRLNRLAEFNFEEAPGTGKTHRRSPSASGRARRGTGSPSQPPGSGWAA